MHLTSILYLLLASSTPLLAVPSPAQQVRLVERGDQTVNAAAGNNLVTDTSIQGNTINITALDAAIGSKQNVNAAIANNAATGNSAQANTINISDAKVGTPGGPPSAQGASAQVAPGYAPAPGVAVAGNAIPPPPTLQIGDTNAQTTNNNAIDNIAAGVTGNTVSGGVQSNSATTQNNDVTGTNNTLIGSISNSNDTYNDSRNITMNTNMTVYDTTFHNQSETNFINTHNNKNVVNNAYYTIQQTDKEGKTQIVYVQAPPSGAPVTGVAANAVAPGIYGGAAKGVAATSGVASSERAKHAAAILQKIKVLNEQVMDLALDVVNDV